ncbi:hypothetical protein [Nereida sp. MMG025]|uniref:hypothetical protein n=1 Tax=Nereida sp. MMG025 TaxID=2909981 RepID=UPI001F228F82|nr:hypothetical protein [Nereida sp. MMG025]MCF6443779.1 hypothetical protein [Nereida sp. MMG025]
MPFDQLNEQDQTIELDATLGVEKSAKLGLLYAALAIGAALWIAAIAIFGLPGLYVPAVAAVPVCFLCLMLITVGK